MIYTSSESNSATIYEEICKTTTARAHKLIESTIDNKVKIIPSWTSTIIESTINHQTEETTKQMQIHHKFDQNSRSSELPISNP